MNALFLLSKVSKPGENPVFLKAPEGCRCTLPVSVAAVSAEMFAHIKDLRPLMGCLPPLH